MVTPACAKDLELAVLKETRSASEAMPGQLNFLF